MKAHLVFSLLPFLFFFPTVDFAQSYFIPESKALVAADVLNVRERPQIQAQVTAKLSLGEEVQIIEMTDSLFTSKDRTYPFIKIYYQEKGQEKEGYVWGGLLSQSYAYHKSSMYLVKHVEGGNTYDNRGVFELIKWEDGIKTTLNNIEVEGLDLELLEEISLTIRNISGLENAAHLINITFTQSACCSFDHEYYYLEMKDNEIISIPPIQNSYCDYHEPRLRYAFPRDENGVENKIVLTETGYDVKGNVAYEEAIDTFGWNGKDFSMYRN